MNPKGVALIRACFAEAERVTPASTPQGAGRKPSVSNETSLSQLPQMSQHMMPPEKVLSIEDDLFEERAAIIEYDGQIERPLAEFHARRQLREQAVARED